MKWEGTMSIICGTDFSPFARHAEDAAAALAGRLGQELWLLHVQEDQSEDMLEGRVVTVVQKSIMADLR